MQRITIPWLIDAIGQIDVAGKIEADKPFSDYWVEAYGAKSILETMITTSVYADHLRTSRQKAQELIEILTTFTDLKKNPLESIVPKYLQWQLKSNYDQFKTIFIAEIATLPSYLITQKENYDTDRLINSGIGLFPQDMVRKVPETLSDAMECGKCLAYEVNTACGFHAFRLLEAVLRKYWTAVSGGQDLPQPTTMGNIAAHLEKNKFGEPGAWQAIKQMARLHRNPLSHADVILSRDEALGIVGLARSVITAMLRLIPVPAMTTDMTVPPNLLLSASRDG